MPHPHRPKGGYNGSGWWGKFLKRVDGDPRYENLPDSHQHWVDKLVRRCHSEANGPFSLEPLVPYLDKVKSGDLDHLVAGGWVEKTPDGYRPGPTMIEILTLPQRAAIVPEIRRQVLQRDGFRCRYCGSKKRPLHMDHILPWSRGGSDRADNLVTACQRCNCRKRDRTPEEAGMRLLPVPSEVQTDGP